MNIKFCNMNKVLFQTVKVQEYNNRETGKSGLTYKLTVEVDNEFVALPCTKEVFDLLNGRPKDTEIIIYVNYSVFYKNIKVENAKVVER